MIYFGERLKRRREEKGLTQEEVASYFGEEFSRQSVSKWERDESYPEVKNLLILSVELDISLDDLFSDELNGYRKKIKGDSGELLDKYPGLVAGLKTLAHALRHIDAKL